MTEKMGATMDRLAEHTIGKLIQRAFTIVGIPVALFVLTEAWAEFKALRNDVRDLARIEAKHNQAQQGELSVHGAALREHDRRLDRLEQRVFQ